MTRPWLREDQPEPPFEQKALATFIEADLSDLVEPGEADAVKPFAEAIRARNVLTFAADPRVVFGPSKKSTRTELPYPACDDARLAIVAALESIHPQSWGAAIEISDSLWRNLRRQPVGNQVCST